MTMTTRERSPLPIPKVQLQHTPAFPVAVNRHLSMQNNHLKPIVPFVRAKSTPRHTKPEKKLYQIGTVQQRLHNFLSRNFGESFSDVEPSKTQPTTPRELSNNIFVRSKFPPASLHISKFDSESKVHLTNATELNDNPQFEVTSNTLFPAAKTQASFSQPNRYIQRGKVFKTRRALKRNASPPKNVKLAVRGSSKHTKLSSPKPDKVQPASATNSIDSTTSLEQKDTAIPAFSRTF